MTWNRWLWVAFVAMLVWFHLLVGTLVAIATVFYWLLSKQSGSTVTVPGDSRTSVSQTVDADDSDEPYVSFDLSDETIQKRSGWYGLTVYADRYELSQCYGGPPSYEEVFEYTVSGKQAYQRLIHQEETDFFRTTDERRLIVVDKGAIVEESMKILEAEDDITYATPEPLFERPNRRADLKAQLSWHETPLADIRYALWAVKNSMQRDVLIAECARLNKAFIAVDVAARKLGGQRNKGESYKSETPNEELLALQSAKGLEPYGITFQELKFQELIFAIINTVTKRGQ